VGGILGRKVTAILVTKKARKGADMCVQTKRRREEFVQRIGLSVGLIYSEKADNPSEIP
jgi:hypothetical protein